MKISKRFHVNVHCSLLKTGIITHQFLIHVWTIKSCHSVIFHIILTFVSIIQKYCFKLILFRIEKGHKASLHYFLARKHVFFFHFFANVFLVQNVTKNPWYRLLILSFWLCFFASGFVSDQFKFYCEFSWCGIVSVLSIKWLP